MMRMPHFVIIGAMKSATTTLQEQLVCQPGIFMTEPKEPNFFSDDDQFAKGLGWYCNLFAEARDTDLLGEASTHYTKLPTYPDAVARLHAQVPDAKLVYVMRHPVDRLVSHYIHEWSMGVYHCDINEAVRRHPEMISYSRYAMQLEPYFQQFGQSVVLPVFFDRLLREPQAELERVCRFIGYKGQPAWMTDLKPGNVSSERIRRFPLYGALIESAPAAWLRRTLVPKGWRDAVKNRLTMKKRPALTDTVRGEIEAIFNQDLARLESWLGCSVNCANFKEVTGARPLDWVNAESGGEQ